jgi:hypothetical protein
MCELPMNGRKSPLRGSKLATTSVCLDAVSAIIGERNFVPITTIEGISIGMTGIFVFCRGRAVLSV